jgi:hypothetical protein
VEYKRVSLRRIENFFDERLLRRIFVSSEIDIRKVGGIDNSRFEL